MPLSLKCLSSSVRLVMIYLSQNGLFFASQTFNAMSTMAFCSFSSMMLYFKIIGQFV